MGVVSVDVLCQGAQEAVCSCRFSLQGGCRLLGVDAGEHADVEFIVLGMVADQGQQGVRGGRVAGACGFEQCLGGLEGVFGDDRVLAVDQGEQVADGPGQRCGSFWVAARTIRRPAPRNPVLPSTSGLAMGSYGSRLRRPRREVARSPSRRGTR
ncbi:hypothetical protein [Streptomyces aureus]|uniref:hypothetical protein n=1 Tax=Streptomyces aureus TaxID=193461 RepID=UPI0005692A8A|nr:hypothetical protein [Streptomyces aureus]